MCTAPHGYVESDVLERARAIVSPDCVIGMELDPHCHLTVKRVRLADITVLYKEFLHTDVVERAELSVSIGHCFPYADVPELTGRIPGDNRQ